MILPPSAALGTHGCPALMDALSVRVTSAVCAAKKLFSATVSFLPLKSMVKVPAAMV